MYVDGSSFSFETSAMYFFCWLTMNRFSLLERIPYCEYGPDGDYSGKGDTLKYIKGDRKFVSGSEKVK